jgi:hypothetical protein
MIHSFCTVAIGYLISNFFWVGSFLLLILTPNFFPEVAAGWALPSEEFNQQWDVDPIQFIPSSLFWIVFVVGVLGSFCAGFVVVKIAPFSHFGHVIFAAVVVFVSWLQQLLSGDCPDAFRWMILLSMISAALATVIGGRFGWQPHEETEEGIEDQML